MMNAIDALTPEAAGQGRDLGEELKAHSADIETWIRDYPDAIPDLFVSPTVKSSEGAEVFVTLNDHRDRASEYFVTRTVLTDEGEERTIYKWPEDHPERPNSQIRTTISKNNEPERTDKKGFEDADLDKINDWLDLAREGI
jgi:hypothetical protein